VSMLRPLGDESASNFEVAALRETLWVTKQLVPASAEGASGEHGRIRTNRGAPFLARR
jgi:hypothetical protein